MHIIFFFQIVVYFKNKTNNFMFLTQFFFHVVLIDWYIILFISTMRLKTSMKSYSFWGNSLVTFNIIFGEKKMTETGKISATGRGREGVIPLHQMDVTSERPHYFISIISVIPAIEPKNKINSNNFYLFFFNIFVFFFVILHSY